MHSEDFFSLKPCPGPPGFPAALTSTSGKGSFLVLEFLDRLFCLFLNFFFFFKPHFRLAEKLQGWLQELLCALRSDSADSRFNALVSGQIPRFFFYDVNIL